MKNIIQYRLLFIKIIYKVSLINDYLYIFKYDMGSGAN